MFAIPNIRSKQPLSVLKSSPSDPTVATSLASPAVGNDSQVSPLLFSTRCIDLSANANPLFQHNVITNLLVTSFAGRVHDARVKYLNKATSKHDYGVVCTDLPLLPFEFGDEIGYFEVEIVSFSGEGEITIGVSQTLQRNIPYKTADIHAARTRRLPGSTMTSYAYHSKGYSFHDNRAKWPGPPLEESDIIGIGVYYEQVTSKIFMTMNGELLPDDFCYRFFVNDSGVEDEELAQAYADILNRGARPTEQGTIAETVTEPAESPTATTSSQNKIRLPKGRYFVPIVGLHSEGAVVEFRFANGQLNSKKFAFDLEAFVKKNRLSRYEENYRETLSPMKVITSSTTHSAQTEPNDDDDDESDGDKSNVALNIVRLYLLESGYESTYKALDYEIAKSRSHQPPSTKVQKLLDEKCYLLQARSILNRFIMQGRIHEARQHIRQLIEFSTNSPCEALLDTFQNVEALDLPMFEVKFVLFLQEFLEIFVTAQTQHSDPDAIAEKALQFLSSSVFFKRIHELFSTLPVTTTEYRQALEQYCEGISGLLAFYPQFSQVSNIKNFLIAKSSPNEFDIIAQRSWVADCVNKYLLGHTSTRLEKLVRQALVTRYNSLYGSMTSMSAIKPYLQQNNKPQLSSLIPSLLAIQETTTCVRNLVWREIGFEPDVNCGIPLKKSDSAADLGEGGEDASMKGDEGEL